MKSSFDRFGDDLIELVLSYIPFEDCFHFRCVSKQWKRLIFNKQKELIILKESKIKFFNEDNNENKFKAIEVIFKNCPNIRSVEIEDKLSDDFFTADEVNEIFEQIIKYCHILHEIKTYFVDDLAVDTMNRFCNKFGSKLKSIEFDWEMNLCQKVF